jgi:hypothetical protein
MTDKVEQQDKRRRALGMDRCNDCHKHFDQVDLAPMLHDKVWRKFADEDETLCGGCMFQRAEQRRVDLDITSLRPCAFNVRLWFDVFRDPSTPLTEEWQEAFLVECKDLLEEIMAAQVEPRRKRKSRKGKAA